MNRTNESVVASLAVVVALLTAGRASAHDMKMMVDLREDPVKVEAWFDDDTPAQQARAVVVRDTGEEVSAGTTDDKGMWSFPKPGGGNYRVVVELAGHQSTIRFSLPEADAGPEALAVEDDKRMNRTLALSIGLTLLLGGSAAFIAIRRLKRDA